jgi:hypothetical protein
MTKPARSGTGKEKAGPGKTREATIRYDLSRDDWDLARDQGNKHFAGQMRLHLGPSLDGLRSDETRELLVRRGIRFIAFRCRTHAPKWPTLADQLVNTLAKTLADFAASEEAVGYGRPTLGAEVTVECVLSPDVAMEAELLGRTGAGLVAVERPAAVEKPEGPDDEIVAKALAKVQDKGLLRHEPQEDEKQRQEDRLSSPAEQFLADLAGRLKPLVAGFPHDPEGRASAAIDLNRALNQAYWNELRSVLRPLIGPLLHEIPPDYKGKQARAVLVNRLLESLHLTIRVRDVAGNMHECGVSAVRGRESDQKGYLRLQDRCGGSARRTYPIPPQAELDVVELPADDPPAPHKSTSRGKGP